VEGAVLDAVSMLLAALILRRPSLTASEVRYLRKVVGDTQEEFARRLEVERVTVNRWENASTPISGTPAYAIRSHVFFRLRCASAAVDAIADTFVEADRQRKPSQRSVYRIDAAVLSA
jgi:transcriptional regulator with XRE-family HTH domain